MKLVHGGDTVGYREKYGRDAVDFSANVSPLGMPAAVAQAIGEAAYHADRYPDPLCRELCAAIARAENVPAEWVLCGNGSADLIFRLALSVRPRRALILAPTFAEYAAALETVGCEVCRYELSERNDFALTPEFANAIDENVDMVFLCQPNNPTGQVANRALMQKILEQCQAVGAWLAVDECFLDFLPDGNLFTMKGELAGGRRLFILKAFTKLYG
ncbi:MAG: aminotransferase class I/II-fold pyridoxal phosphate-dependent enzyme, partial [Christensenellales bacterium]|nr:aminotransferase class I/II-fold pyridoxal phosphate-dependent enzyme [Christensenellales bacterium]